MPQCQIGIWISVLSGSRGVNNLLGRIDDRNVWDRGMASATPLHAFLVLETFWDGLGVGHPSQLVM